MLRASTRGNIPWIIENKVQLGKHQVNYVRVGPTNKNREKALLLLPGALGSAQSHYSYQLRDFPVLLKDFAIVSWDAPGYGKSRPPNKEFHLDWYWKNAKIAHQLMQSLAFRSYSVLGWNDGSVEAMIMASLFPRVVENIIIFGTRAYFTPRDRKISDHLRNINEWSTGQRESLAAVYGVESLRVMANAWSDMALEICRKRSGNICKDILDKIQCPTLIIHGAKDPVISTEHAPYLHKKIKNSQMHIFPDAKHNVHQTCHKEFNDLVASFLKE